MWLFSSAWRVVPVCRMTALSSPLLSDPRDWAWTFRVAPCRIITNHFQDWRQHIHQQLQPFFLLLPSFVVGNKFFISHDCSIWCCNPGTCEHYTEVCYKVLLLLVHLLMTHIKMSEQVYWQCKCMYCSPVNKWEWVYTLTPARPKKWSCRCLLTDQSCLLYTLFTLW